MGMTVRARDDTSNDVVNPLEDPSVFDWSNISTSEDYNLDIRNQNFDVTKLETLTNDPEEEKLDYWREDTLLHVFHSLFHKLHRTAPRLKKKHKKHQELF